MGVDGVQVVDLQPDPGPETLQPLRPVRHGTVEPHLGAAEGQFDVRDRAVIVAPPATFDESEDLLAPGGDVSGVSAEHVGNGALDGERLGHRDLPCAREER